MKTIIAKLKLKLASRAASGGTMNTIDNYMGGKPDGSSHTFMYAENPGNIDAPFQLSARMTIVVDDRGDAVDSLKTFVTSALFAGDAVQSFTFSFSEKAEVA